MLTVPLLTAFAYPHVRGQTKTQSRVLLPRHLATRPTALKPVLHVPGSSARGHLHDPPSRLLARASTNKEDGPPSDGDDMNASTSLSGRFNRLRISTQIFMVVLVYIAYFFGKSAWDGKSKKH